MKKPALPSAAYLLIECTSGLGWDHRVGQRRGIRTEANAFAVTDALPDAIDEPACKFHKSRFRKRCRACFPMKKSDFGRLPVACNLMVLGEFF
jgi:hypothetical protein